MNGRVYVLIVLIVFAVLHAPAIGQGGAQGEKLLARADHKAAIEGDLKGAIEEYRKIAAGAGANRRLAAEALVRMAECHQKLGDTEARTIYQRVVREYADQTSLAMRARAGLAALVKPRAAAASGLVSRQIWTGPQVDTLGSVSPDGQLLSFVDWETGDLSLRDLTTGANRRLTNKGSWNDSSEFALFSRISPDGRLIAYNWMKKNFGWEIRIAPLDGSPHRVVFSSDVNDEYAHPEAWSPDGRRLAIMVVTGERYEIALVPTDGGPLRVLTASGPRPPSRVIFSPDGAHLAYETTQGPNESERDIHLITIDGGSRTPLIAHAADDYLLGWLPDGRLLFASDRGGTVDAWSVRVKDGKTEGTPELAKKDLGNVDTLGLTRAGALFYGMRSTGPDVYIAPLDPQSHLAGAAARAPRRFIGTNIDPAWSPDGRRLAFVSERGWPPGRAGARVLCTLDLESGVQKEFPVHGTSPQWSPDGRSILLRVASNEHRGLRLVDVASGEVSTVLSRDSVQRARWSSDGSALYLVRADYGRSGTKGQESWISIRDRETGQETELYRESVPAPVGDQLLNDLTVSPDGTLLAFTVQRDKVKRVLILPAGGGAAREVIRTSADLEVPNFANLSWTPDGKEIVFVKGHASVAGGNARGAHLELWAVPLTGGQPRPLGLSAQGLSRVQVHPATHQIVFQSGIRSLEVWAIENLGR